MLNAENATLDKAARDDLVRLATYLVGGYETQKLFEELKSMNEENQWRNWYFGYTKAVFPFSDYEKHFYDVSTTAVPGSASSPLFGQAFTEETFLFEFSSQYSIYLPDNITGMGNLSMVMQMKVDTKDNSGAAMFQYDTLSIYSNTNTPTKYKNTGYVNETLHFLIDTEYNVEFFRRMDRATYAEWVTKRNTGFSMAWHVENSTGHRVDIQPWDKYSREEANEVFVSLVNILHQATTVHNMSVAKVWEHIRVLNISANDEEQCGHNMKEHDVIKRVFKELYRRLNMTIVKGPAYKDYVTDATLDTAALIFVYIMHCPTYNPTGLAWIHFYTDLFQNFPPRYILQTLANLSKKKTSGKNTKNVPADLLQELGNYISFEHEMINLGLTSQKGQLKKYGSEFEYCIDENSCDAIDNVFRIIGSLLLN